MICEGCERELDCPAGVCPVELMDQFVGRIGGHGGRCWGGRYPTADQMNPAKLSDHELEMAKARGAARFAQLQLDAMSAGQAADK